MKLSNLTDPDGKDKKIQETVPGCSFLSCYMFVCGLFEEGKKIIPLRKLSYIFAVNVCFYEHDYKWHHLVTLVTF